MPVIQPVETVSSTVGWSTQPAGVSRAGRMQSINVSSLLESSSSVASAPVNDLLAQPSELWWLSVLGFDVSRSSCRHVSVRPSVCTSVTSRHCTKMAKHRITQTVLHNSPGTLVF